MRLCIDTVVDESESEAEDIAGESESSTTDAGGEESDGGERDDAGDDGTGVTASATTTKDDDDDESGSPATPQQVCVEAACSLVGVMRDIYVCVCLIAGRCGGGPGVGGREEGHTQEGARFATTNSTKPTNYSRD